MPAWTRLDTALLVAVTAVAALVRFVSLGTPDQLVFDEIWYAQNACLLATAPDICGIAAPVSAAHPPLGQWLIAAGIAENAGVFLNVVALSVGAVSVVAPLYGSSPIFVLLLSYVFLRGVEVLSGRIVAGTALIVLGVYLITAF